MTKAIGKAQFVAIAHDYADHILREKGLVCGAWVLQRMREVGLVWECDPRAMGAVFNRNPLLEDTGEFRRYGMHKAPVRMWRRAQSAPTKRKPRA